MPTEKKCFKSGAKRFARTDENHVLFRCAKSKRRSVGSGTSTPTKGVLLWTRVALLGRIQLDGPPIEYFADFGSIIAANDDHYPDVM